MTYRHNSAAPGRCPGANPDVTFTRTLALATALLAPSVATAAPVLAAATIRIAVTSHTTCSVTMMLRLEGATEIEHRIEAFEGSTVTLDDVTGGAAIGEPRTIGRTRSLIVRIDRPDYELRYTAVQSADRQDRCPLWVPAVPASGRLGAVRLDVRLPDGSQPASAMPSLAWTGLKGETAVSHVPAFVRVMYAAPGETASWDLLAVMDGLAVATFVAASALWLWRRIRQRAPRVA